MTSGCVVVEGDLVGARVDARAALMIDGSDSDTMALLDAIEYQASVAESNPPTPPTPPTPSTPPTPASSAPTPSSPPPPAAAPAPPSSPAPVAARAVDPIASETLKDQGNAAMKKDDFALAVQLYTQALAADPTNVNALSNRAQAHLKLNNFKEAEADAHEVVTKSPSGASIVQKALYRRAMARKGLGGSRLQDALADLQQLIKDDPSNESFKKALAQLKRDMAPINVNVKAPSSSSPSGVPKAVSSPPTQPSSVSAPGLGLKALKSTKYDKPRDGGAEPAALSKATGANEAQAAEEIETPSGAGPTKTKKKGPVKVALKAPEVPIDPPKTLYELERVWRGLKDHPSLFAQYLGVFKKSTCKRVFKESLSNDLMTSLLGALRDHAPPQTSVTILTGLSEASGFGMAVQLLPAEDLNCLRDIFTKLEGTSDTAKVVGGLKGVYGF